MTTHPLLEVLTTAPQRADLPRLQAITIPGAKPVVDLLFQHLRSGSIDWRFREKSVRFAVEQIMLMPPPSFRFEAKALGITASCGVQLHLPDVLTELLSGRSVELPQGRVRLMQRPSKFEYHADEPAVFIPFQLQVFKSLPWQVNGLWIRPDGGHLEIGWLPGYLEPQFVWGDGTATPEDETPPPKGPVATFLIWTLIKSVGWWLIQKLMGRR